MGDNTNSAKEISENQVQEIFHFPTAIYKIDKPEFLLATTEVTTDFLNKSKKEVEQLNEIYPVSKFQILIDRSLLHVAINGFRIHTSIPVIDP